MHEMLSILADLPNPTPAAPPGLEAKVSTVLAWVKWGALVAALIGLMVGVAKLAIARRNHGQEGVMETIGMPVVVVIIVSAGASLLTALM